MQDQRARRARTLLALASAAALVAGAAATAPAAADTAPPTPATPATVSADVLPTVQVDGVVWDQVVVGDTVYATGSFSTARPAGAAPGTGEVPRSNILAYTLSTGRLVQRFAPALDAQGMAIAASADGKTIYVGGDFTTAGGKPRARIAAIEASTGTVRRAFLPKFNGRIRALEVSGTTVYAGGTFTVVAGKKRTRLVALTGDRGAVLPWSVSADAEVLALTAPPGTKKVVIGGRFATLNGKPAVGMGAVDATTGAVGSWKINAVVRNSGAQSGITSLTSDATRVFGTGYSYTGGTGNLEGLFAASVTSGAVSWINGCKGDHYDTLPAGTVLYAVSHAHNCAMVGGMPETTPRTYQRAMAWTAARAADRRVNTSGTFRGRLASELLHWDPQFAIGTVTGQNQGPWTIEGNASYVAVGGEFPSVGGVPQQGLARFAIRSKAPNAAGPVGGWNQLTPEVDQTAGGAALRWTAAWDADNRLLVHEVLRGDPATSATVVDRQTVDSAWWARPAMSAVDTAAPPGPAVYRIRVTDPLGNVVLSRKVEFTPPTR